MGTFRLLLAFMVFLAHTPGVTLVLNVSVSAVICFYFISGYLVSWSYSHFRASSPRPVRDFFIDRLIRLYPAFLVVFLITVLLKLAAGRVDPLTFATLLDALIIPSNYTRLMVEDSIIPPAWSLGTELQFYLLLPLLFLLRERTKLGLIVVLSAGLFLAFQWPVTLQALPPGADGIQFCERRIGNYPMPCIHTVSEILAYRLPLLPLVYFLFGHLCFVGRDMRLAGALFWGANAFMLLAGWSLGMLKNPYMAEQIFSALVLIPLGYLLLRRLRARGFGRFDAFLGELAYPVFLLHYLCMWIVWAFGKTAYEAELIWGLTLLASVWLALFQRLVDRLRYRYRGFGKFTKPA